MLTATARATERLVIGVDGSDAGWAALAWACEEAEVRTANLTICQVDAPDRTVPSTRSVSTLELTRPILARHVHSTRQRLGGARVGFDTATGNAAAALLAHADGADLLVIGGHDHAGSLRHSTSARIAAHARCPVVIVRPIPRHGHASFSGHVVVGVGDGASARDTIRFGFAYAALHRLPLVAVRVDDGRRDDYWFDEDLLETHFADEPAPLHLLATLVEPVAAEYPMVKVKLAVFAGQPVDGLRRASVGARLLVLGRHDHRLPSALWFGSVSQAFTANASCVVAIVAGTPQQ